MNENNNHEIKWTCDYITAPDFIYCNWPITAQYSFSKNLNKDSKGRLVKPYYGILINRFQDDCKVYPKREDEFSSSMNDEEVLWSGLSDVWDSDIISTLFKANGEKR